MEQVKEYFYIALRGLRTRSLRSWLTILGIVIGVFLIISLLSLSEGLKSTINKQLQALGGEMVMVMPGGDEDFLSGMIFGGAKLEKADLEAIKKAEGVDTVIGYSYTGTPARYKKEAKQIAIAGLDPWKESLEIMTVFQGWSLAEGRWPSKGNQILIGSHVADGIFSKKVKVESEMVIKGRKFEVAGVLKSLGNQQDDSMVYMDMNVYQGLTGEKRGTAAYAMAKLEKGVDENVVAEAIEEALEKTRKRRFGTDEADFSVITSERMGDITGTILGIIQFVIIGFASIAILVGGIGITNTMFTSVREKTREIGIMKAIGAKNSAVLSIILFEAGIIGLLGGIGGTLLGSILAVGINYYGQTNPAFYFTTSVSPGLIVFGLAFSFFIGCAAGFFPARSATKLKPVEALRRYE
ncbi:MAG: ABC transporter permease [Candidatus Nealsonbacteria bacterium]|nr:MAG: ABC transporter permease [Candidatus Nealsonbacteria bacterium]